MSLPDVMMARRDALIDGVVVELRSSIPSYDRVDAHEIRQSISFLFDEMVQLLQGATDQRAADEHLADVFKRRALQGFTSADVLRASLMIRPVVRRVLADLPELTDELNALDALLQERAVAATNVFVDESQRRLEVKNQALRRMNDELQAHRAALSREVETTVRALTSARTLNAKIIESLVSGVIVVQNETFEVLVYSPRAEQILMLPAEDVLGHNAMEATKGLAGLEAERLVDAVLRNGELPLTKRRIGLPNGQFRWVYLSARRLVDDEGNSEGTVVVIDDVTERELLLDSFSRYVSRDVVHRLLARGAVELTGERRVVTVLFADIRGFTGLAERLRPEVLHHLLNRYFRVMIGAVTEHGGLVDKFVGDKVMAIFGHGPSTDQGANAAVQAALALHAGLLEMAESEPMVVGIGINTGEVVLGNVGSEQRMEFTAIGDAVNVADRLQNLARDGEILVGPGTRERIERPMKAWGAQPLRGRQRSIEVFEVLRD